MYKENTALVSQSKQVFLLSEKLLSNCELHYAALKNYANAANEADLMETRLLDSSIKEDLQQLIQNTGHSKAQVLGLDTITKSVGQYLDFTQSILGYIHNGDTLLAIKSLRNEASRDYLRTIEKSVVKSHSLEADLLADHKSVHELNTTDNGIALIVIVLLTIVLLVLIFLRARRTYKSFNEKELIESENKYRLLVESSPDAIVIYQDAKIVFVNEHAILTMKASSKADLIGKSVIDFVHPDQKVFVINRMKMAVVDSDTLPTAEEKFVCLDGTIIDVEVKAIPFTLNQKNPFN
jgi:PAS domain S-box-containing protein